jgi:hypothetical protein
MLLPLGTILLTPIFGRIYDKKGKGATIMILGSFILVLVHAVFSIPSLNIWWIATAMVIILGVGFSLVPSAMWPSVPKIIPEKQLGTAYAVIFWVQNFGLWAIPFLLGFVLNATNPSVAPNKKTIKTAIEKAFYEKVGDSFNIKQVKIAIEKASTSTVDSIVQYANYVPMSENEIDTTKVKNMIYLGIKQNFNNVDISGDQKEALIKMIKLAKNSAYVTVEKERLNIKYDYFYDMLIFLGLAIFSVLFGFLLKIEDKRKGYGLEMPNV